MALILEYLVSRKFLNAPCISVVVLLPDASGQEKPVTLCVADDDARAICTMVKNPDPSDPDDPGTVATGAIDFAALQKFVDTKVSELMSPGTAAEKVTLAEQAMQRAREADARKAELDIEISEAAAELAALQKAIDEAKAAEP